MKFTLTIDCDNAAFGDDAWDTTLEVERILRVAANRLHAGRGMDEPEALLDSNGNVVGSYRFDTAKRYPGANLPGRRNMRGGQ